MGDSTVVAAPRLAVAATIRRGIELCAREWRLLVGVAFVVEVPVAALSLGSATIVDADLSADVGFGYTLTLLLLMFWAAFGHHALLALIERIEEAGHVDHPDKRLRTILRGLPYGRLLVADVVVTTALALGLAALVVPGVVVAVWTAPVFPLLTMERRTVRDTLARSFTIVRGNAWPILWILACSSLAIYAGGLVASALVHEVAGEADGLAVLGHALTEAVLAPIGAAITVVATFELVAIDAGRTIGRTHVRSPR
jgi:hypothetical protein